MIIFNEGVPRSGKSYDAVKNHILPALQKSRHVYVRLNFQPDSEEQIAKYLGKPVEFVQEFLHMIPSSEVQKTFIAEQDESGEWVLPPHLVNAVVIVDECHEFYVANKQSLPPEVENFFAMAGHYGTDILLMSQFYKRLHSAIRGRIERKTSFQKLSALGMDGKYNAIYWQTVSPDKYEKLGTKMHTYEPPIFPLYKGFKEGANVEVYEGGKRSAWRQFLVPGIIVISLGIWGVYYLVGFFTGGIEVLPGSKEKEKVAIVEMSTVVPNSETAQPLPAVRSRDGKTVEKVKEMVEPLADLDPVQAYVFGLADKGRARLVVVMEAAGRKIGVVEWRDSNNVVNESLTTVQLAAMNVAVTWTAYGLSLAANKHTLVVTAWPLQQPVREQEARLYSVDGPDGNMGTFSPPVTAQALGGATAGGGSAPRIGDNKAAIRE